MDDVEKILESSKDDIDGIFDENARAEYAKAIAKLYETKIKERELEQQERNRQFENDLKQKELKSEKAKTISDIVIKTLDVIVKGAVGAAGVIIPAALYQKCWNEGMRFEEKGVFTSSTFKDLKRNIKLRF